MKYRGNQPMLRTFGIHGREQRANELLLEDALSAEKSIDLIRSVAEEMS